MDPQRACPRPARATRASSSRGTHPADASNAYHVFLTRTVFEGQKVVAVNSNGLGTEGAGFRYIDATQGRPVTGVRFIWRSAKRVFDLAVAGSADFASESTVRTLADEVNARNLEPNVG